MTRTARPKKVEPLSTSAAILDASENHCSRNAGRLVESKGGKCWVSARGDVSEDVSRALGCGTKFDGGRCLTIIIII